MRRPNDLPLTLILIAGLPGWLAAQTPAATSNTPRATSLTCSTASTGASCLAAHYSELDRLLGETYKAALARIEQSGLGRNLVMDWKRALLETQRKWIAYREADCGPPLTYETTSTPAITATRQLRCKIAHTESRLATLLIRYPAE